MIKPKLIYIGKPGSRVFQSQVIELLLEINKGNYFSDVILLAGENSSNKEWKAHVKDKLTNLKVFTFKQFPNYHFYYFKQKKALNKVLSQLVSPNTIIHTRGESYTKILYKIINNISYNNVYIYTDVRGAVYEETLLYNKSAIGLHQLKLFQHKRNLKNLGKHSDYISCVSQKLKEYILNRTRIDKDRIFVNHCIAGKDFEYSDKMREIYRKKLKINESEILFLFSTGGNSNWQNTNEIITNISKRGFKILNLSKNKIDLPNVINLYVDLNIINNYLCAADIGVIWRNDDIVNHVASPVKFSEYICSGLPIVANKGVCLINDYVENTRFGVSIDSFDDLDLSNIHRLMSLDRNEISNYGIKHFSSAQIAKKIIVDYKNILH